MKKFLLWFFGLCFLSISCFASLTVESAIYPITTASFTIATSSITTCSSNYEGFWFLQNASATNIWISPFSVVKTDGSYGGFKLQPTGTIYFKPRYTLGKGSKLYAIAESGTNNVLCGWIEQF